MMNKVAAMVMVSNHQAQKQGVWFMANKSLKN
jgi:hypothetical protein